MSDKTVVIFPIYKQHNIPDLVQICLNFLKKNATFQFIFVDDGCPIFPDYYHDVTNAGFILRKHDKNLGKGAAVKTGALHALTLPCKHIIFMDSDLSCSLDQLSNIIAPLDAGCSFVFGSRQHSESTIICRQHIIRELSGKLFNTFLKTMLFRGIHDTQCGFKGFTKEAAALVFKHLHTSRFSFDVELFLWAKKFNLTIKAIPVNWENSSDSTVSFWKDTLNIFCEILILKIKHTIIFPFKIHHEK